MAVRKMVDTQMFTGEKINTYNYEKHDKAKDFGIRTGKALQVETSPYCVIDFDVYTDERKESLKPQILEHFTGKAKIVQTYSGGFHIYFKDDKIWHNLPHNRYCPVYRSEDESFNIDVLTSNPTGRNLVVLPGSKVKSPKSNNQVREYVVLSDCEDDNLITFSDGLAILAERFNIQIQKPKGKKIVQIQNPETDEDEPNLERPTHQPPLSKQLFNAIIEGFVRIPIHGESQDIEKEVGVLHIVSGLNACENDEISKEDIETSLDRIYNIADLTDRAKERWGDICWRNRNTKAVSWRILQKIIRLFNHDYFLREIMPLIASKNQFEESTYTFVDYQKEAGKFTNKWDHLNALAKCVAIDTQNGGLIVKMWEADQIIYRHMKFGELKNEFKLFITIITDDKEKEYELSNFLARAENKQHLRSYYGMGLRPVRADSLWNYRGITGTDYDPDLAIGFIEFMKSRVKYEKPLMEEFYSHAYRLQNHHHVMIEKFFIHYGEGNDGKTMFLEQWRKIYPGLSNIGAKPEEITNLHNDMFAVNLLLWIEEGYSMGSEVLFETIKRGTNRTGSVRGIQKQSRETPHAALFGMNTNHKELMGVGLTKSKADEDRLVIIEFKPISNLHPDRATAQAMFEEQVGKFIDQPNFAYSFYRYLKEEMVIPEDFNQRRYYGKEKYEYIKKLKEIRRTSVETWLEWLAIRLEEGRAGLRQNKFKKTGEQIQVWQEPDWWWKSYSAYCEENTIRGRFGIDQLRERMKELGFIQDKSNGLRRRYISLDAFKNFILEDEEDDDNGIVEEFE